LSFGTIYEGGNASDAPFFFVTALTRRNSRAGTPLFKTV
jgi:hypothetical protein